MCLPNVLIDRFIEASDVKRGQNAEAETEAT